MLPFWAEPNLTSDAVLILASSYWLLYLYSGNFENRLQSEIFYLSGSIQNQDLVLFMAMDYLIFYLVLILLDELLSILVFNCSSY